jgi:D-glycerate 3-kinase
MSTLQSLLHQITEQHRLPPAFRRTVQRHYVPLAAWVAAQKPAAQPLVLGINGSQGSGKSTLVEVLGELLAHSHGLRVAILSLDDLYHTRARRLELGVRIHPLLRTRGVPGTHDVHLGQQVLQRLKTLREGEALALPRFSKAADDRVPQQEWPQVQGPVDVVLFEGWCLCTPPQALQDLAEPVNALETVEDADSGWRHYVNEQLATVYATLFKFVDRLVMLKAPDFDTVYHWRMEQEQRNAAMPGNGPRRIMSPDGVRRFVRHYQRLTEHTLRVLPALAHVVIELDYARNVLAVQYR